jgi:predicted transposase/invertase (TIGR01784 family)
MNLLNPQVDFVFKRIFGAEGNQDILLSFLNAVFEDAEQPRVASVEILNPFLEKDAMTDKMSVVDVKARTENGTLINIEIQLSDHHDMAKRTLYYWAKMFEDQLAESAPYKDLRKTITINVLSFAYLPGDRFHTTFHLQEDRSHYPLTDLCEIHFIELAKITN